ncbi:hypothetical protein [Bacteroides acidifaciens]|uniref:hypothetical protein n=1 Tax=Bacteroides acidifaciens TaxID=85831 RepID=UPI003F68E1F1
MAKESDNTYGFSLACIWTFNLGSPTATDANRDDSAVYGWWEDGNILVKYVKR